MLKQPGRTVYQRPDGSWAIKDSTADRPSSVHASLLEAERLATELLVRDGGGVLITTQGWGERVVMKRKIVA